MIMSFAICIFKIEDDFDQLKKRYVLALLNSDIVPTIIYDLFDIEYIVLHLFIISFSGKLISFTNTNSAKMKFRNSLINFWSNFRFFVDL